MTEAQAETFRWNPFDLTKVWPHSDFPITEIGVLELNRNPENYFAEVEQAAFSPSAFVPGIGPSPDKVLQARLMSYADAHRYRVGTNYQQVPVNQPRCPVMHYQRDGAMSVGYRGSSTNYYPNMRQLCHFFRADADYGQRIAKALNVPIDAAMLQQNQQDNPQPVSV